MLKFINAFAQLVSFENVNLKRLVKLNLWNFRCNLNTLNKISNTLLIWFLDYLYELCVFLKNGLIITGLYFCTFSYFRAHTLYELVKAVLNCHLLFNSGNIKNNYVLNQFQNEASSIKLCSEARSKRNLMKRAVNYK